MSWYCKQLDKDFDSQEQMFKALKDNETKIITLKRAAVHKSIDKGQLSGSLVQLKDGSIKGLEFMKDGYIYPVINTTKYMDSHDDVHIDGLWKKSISEQQGLIYYLTDHDMTMKSVVAWPESVEVFTKELDWSTLGAEYKGTTQALIYKIPIDGIVNDDAKKAIEAKRPLQNSVRMKYIQIKMALDSNTKEYAINKAVFDKYIDTIANKDKAKEQGYFFVVEEAQIYKEGSLVLFGSNDITPILTPEPQQRTPNKIEPDESTQITVEEFIKQVKLILKP